jgi:hypothetical protein
LQDGSSWQDAFTVINSAQKQAGSRPWKTMIQFPAGSTVAVPVMSEGGAGVHENPTLTVLQPVAVPVTVIEVAAGPGTRLPPDADVI